MQNTKVVFMVVDDRVHGSRHVETCYNNRDDAVMELERIRRDIRNNAYRVSIQDEEDLQNDMYVSSLNLV